MAVLTGNWKEDLAVVEQERAAHRRGEGDSAIQFFMDWRGMDRWTAKYHALNLERSISEKERFEAGDVKYVNRYTRVKKSRGSLYIVCPNCFYTSAVVHLSWAGLLCTNCNTLISKNDWILPEQ